MSVYGLGPAGPVNAVVDRLTTQLPAALRTARTRLRVAEVNGDVWPPGPVLIAGDEQDLDADAALDSMPALVVTEQESTGTRLEPTGEGGVIWQWDTTIAIFCIVAGFDPVTVNTARRVYTLAVRETLLAQPALTPTVSVVTARSRYRESHSELGRAANHHLVGAFRTAFTVRSVEAMPPAIPPLGRPGLGNAFDVQVDVGDTTLIPQQTRIPSEG